MLPGGYRTTIIIQAIIAATGTASRVIRMEDQAGSIQAGREADLFIVDGDSTAVISALSRVRMIMQAGQIVFRKSD